MQIALALLVLLATLSIARAASPLDELIAPKADTSACFTRIYDAAHLRKNPKQMTISMAVRFSYDKPEATPPELHLGVGLAMVRKGDALPWFAQGGCRWIAQVNVDTSGRPLVKEFKKNIGGGCMMAAIPDVFDTLSAEEGGYLIVDRGKDADTLMVYLQDDLMMVKQESRDKPVMRPFGAADRVFMLQRAPAAACDFVQRAFTR